MIAMGTKYIKPDLRKCFNAIPEIGSLLNDDYDKANTFEQLALLVHKWLNTSDDTENKIKKHWYKIAAYNLFSILTRRGYHNLLHLIPQLDSSNSIKLELIKGRWLLNSQRYEDLPPHLKRLFMILLKVEMITTKLHTSA